MSFFEGLSRFRLLCFLLFCLSAFSEVQASFGTSHDASRSLKEKGNSGRSLRPTVSPTGFPSVAPSEFPTTGPSSAPTEFPTRSPTKPKTKSPTFAPTKFPTRFPRPSPTSFPSVAPTPFPSEVPLFPNEFRIGNNYVGLMFLNDLDEASLQAFIDGANRWSKIVGGTLGQFSVEIDEEFDFCGTGNTLPSKITVDHLIIAAQVAPIDGVDGILGQAGPCAVTEFFPVAGIMSFDSADISQLNKAGTLSSVILHEMGHVLGIGTIFSYAGLMKDLVFQGNGTKISSNQPKFLGGQAISKYKLLTERLETFVPVENGITNGVNLFPGSTAGEGSIDAHWDEDFMPGELMVFRIDIEAGAPLLSAVTIASLKDLGYTVDFSEADEYVAEDEDERRRHVAKSLEGDNQSAILINDVIFHEFDLL